MEPTVLFGRIPEELLLPADTAQYELFLWNQALERRLYREWCEKAPTNLSRRSRMKWSGRRLARAMRLRKEQRIVNALFVARGGILGDSWARLPATPNLETATAQLRALAAFDDILQAYINRWPRETLKDYDAASDEATAQCKAVYWHYWNSLE